LVLQLLLIQNSRDGRFVVGVGVVGVGVAAAVGGIASGAEVINRRVAYRWPGVGYRSIGPRGGVPGCRRGSVVNR
jgi:hypothetical protein